MDSARDRRSWDIIDAEQLWDMELVIKDAYQCPECGIQVFPASYKRDINKRRPYFTPMHNKHINDCGADGIEALLRRAKKDGVGTPDGFPVPFPNRLIMNETAPVASDTDIQQGGAGPKITRTRSNTAFGIGYHGHTAKTIRPICRIFIDYPHDRPQLKLSIPGCPGTTYETVFCKLNYHGIRFFHSPTRLFYAPLRWNSAAETNEGIEWLLDAGTWQKDEKRPSTFYRVSIRWGAWTERKRDILHSEIEIAQKEVRGKTDQPEKAWLFFVGTQDTDDPSLLVVDRHNLICCRVGHAV